MATETTALTGPLALADWPQLESTSLPASLDALVRQACARHPDSLAWQFVDVPDRRYARLTYGELDGVIDCYAAALMRAGVGRQTHVAVMLPNVPEFPLTWLALARLGAVMVPLNPAYTTREIDHVVGKSQATHMVLDGERAGVVLSAGSAGACLSGRIILIDDGADAAAKPLLSLNALLAEAAEDGTPVVELEPETLVNIQFTSGTTGLPKGCMLTHRYWVQLGLVGVSLGGPSKRMLADHPFFYMQNQAYLATALWSGATLVVTRGLSRSKFLDWIDDYEIDFAWYVDVLSDPSIPPGRGRSLAHVPSAGVHGTEHAAVEERYGIVMRDHYASTEAGSAIAVPVDRGEMMATPGALGMTVPFRASKIVDGELNEVAPGVAGELCLHGPGMMLGYFDEPEINAQTFFDGWLRTGDLVIKEENGEHFYLGRIKDSISRSDENISAVEVEQVLEWIPGVDEAAVIGVPDEDRGQEVKAYILREPGAQDLDPEAIFEACRSQLALFKIPRFIEFVTEFPMTAGSGKISKGTLRTSKPDLRAGSYDRLASAWLPE
jgi:acyl-CoA synthetase (AMP-forming)/AMP-acid ligase II